MRVLIGVGSVLGGPAFNPLVALPLILLAALCFIPLAMALWFAPALVVIHDVQPWPAMKASLVVCLKNWAPFLVYGLALIPLAILAALPVFLGFLVLSPVIYASIYAGYKGMFLR